MEVGSFLQFVYQGMWHGEAVRYPRGFILSQWRRWCDRKRAQL